MPGHLGIDAECYGEYEQGVKVGEQVALDGGDGGEEGDEDGGDGGVDEGGEEEEGAREEEAEVHGGVRGGAEVAPSSQLTSTSSPWDKGS